MLRKLRAGKIKMEPVKNDAQKGYRLSGRLNIGRLLQARGVAGSTGRQQSDGGGPTGFEPVFQP